MDRARLVDRTQPKDESLVVDREKVRCREMERAK